MPRRFVHVLDDRTLAFADRPGNDWIGSMRNLMNDDRLDMLFLSPGLNVFMRVNGRGAVLDNPELCAVLAGGAKVSKPRTVVAVEEALFHCGKVVNRARLRDPASRIDRASLPTPVRMLAATTKGDGAAADAIGSARDHHDFYG